MRSASICVLPDPAPASTSRLVSSSSRMKRRDSRSMTRESVMRRQPRVCLQGRIPQLGASLLVNVCAARLAVVAPLAGVLVGRMDERPADDHVTQICQNRSRLSQCRCRDRHSLLTALVAGEVIDSTRELRLLVFHLQQLDDGEAIESVLQATTLVEGATPAIAPESTCLVVENFEFRWPDFVDPIDPASYSECQPLAQINLDSLGTCERF